MVIFTITTLHAHAQDAATVMKNMDKALNAAQDQKIEIKMILLDKKGGRTVRKAITYQKGIDKRYFKFTYPEAYKGIALLSLPNDVMYVYLPAYAKERRIASSAKKGNFQGTDFSYDNMESKPYSEKYDAVSVTETGDYYILTSKPKTGTKSPYSKLVTKVIKTSYYPKEVEFYDLKGVKFKKLVNTKIEQINGYNVATDFTMTNLRTGHKTQMIFSEVSYDSGLPDDLFTLRNLKK